MANKYLRTIYGIDKDGKPGSLQVDVYNVLDAYPTKNPALDHLIKKALCPGQRGHKDLLTDLDDIIKSAQRAKELVVNQLACSPDAKLPTEGEAYSLCEGRVGSVVKPTHRQAFPDIKGTGISEEGIAAIQAKAKASMAAALDVEPVSPTKTSEGYYYSFSDRPASFDNAIIYVVEGVDPVALERLESEAGPCDTVIEYVRSHGDCPKGAIVIYNNHTKIPLDGEYWNYSINKAIDILVNDQKGKLI